MDFQVLVLTHIWLEHVTCDCCLRSFRLFPFPRSDLCVYICKYVSLNWMCIDCNSSAYLSGYLAGTKCYIERCAVDLVYEGNFFIDYTRKCVNYIWNWYAKLKLFMLCHNKIVHQWNGEGYWSERPPEAYKTGFDYLCICKCRENVSLSSFSRKIFIKQICILFHW